MEGDPCRTPWLLGQGTTLFKWPPPSGNQRRLPLQKGFPHGKQKHSSGKGLWAWECENAGPHTCTTTKAVIVSPLLTWPSRNLGLRIPILEPAGLPSSGPSPSSSLQKDGEEVWSPGLGARMKETIYGLCCGLGPGLDAFQGVSYLIAITPRLHSTTHSFHLLCARLCKDRGRIAALRHPSEV